MLNHCFCISFSAMWNLGSILLFVLLFEPCKASIQKITSIARGFEAVEMTWVDNNGLFLLSNSSNFAFGFQPTKDVTLFLLVIIHMGSNRQIWTANRGNPVQGSDAFAFDSHGNVSLQSGGNIIWSPDTGGKPVSSIQLLDSGNLVMLGGDNTTVWESFKHPTDTLLSNQVFTEGMNLSSNPDTRNLSYFLQLRSGDLQLFVDFSTPQPYWAMSKDPRRVINRDEGSISQAVIDGNSWKFYGKDKVLLMQFIFSKDASLNSTWIAVLENDGSISFLSLETEGTVVASQTKIPSDSCDAPGHCGAYYSCSSNTCQCSAGLLSRNCNTGIASSPCANNSDSNASTEMVYAGDDLSYFALDFVSPTSKTDLNQCKASCSSNCSCLAVFFNNETRNCFLFGNVGSFKVDSSSNYAAYVKVSTKNDAGGGGSSNKHSAIVAIISVVTVLVIVSMLYGGYKQHMKKKEGKMGNVESPQDGSEEDNFLGSLSGMPVRYSYKDLETATNSFAVKLGQGGFGSVYQGVLHDGTRIAVKQLEGVGQGKKEFRAEVGIIGSIHHNHLVRLRGFCTEGSHRLLAYEFMAKNSLDKWIFKKNKDGVVLDWDTRFNIAVGTAKGLAYLHEDCDVKIVHCDIKPENVLLDDNFQAKVSDFGLAKLMTREQSHVFTTLRGTRGYLAPEWITNYAISEKSDVYSYGMVLLEIIGGRKNYDPQQTSEKSHFPSFAFRKMEEGKLMEVLDSSLKYNQEDESVSRAIKVALWCIQEDMSKRPSMSKVVQMLEGLCHVPQPPTSSLSGSRLFASFFKDSSEGTGTGTSSGPSDCNSETYQSAVRLSGPR